MPVVFFVMEEFDYNTAFQYFLKNSQNEILKRIFARGESVYTRTRLKEELKKLKVPPAAVKNDRPPAEREQVIDFYTLPTAVKTLIERRNTARKARNFHFTLMQNSPTPADRAEHLATVLEEDKELEGLQARIDHFYKHGQLPTEKPTTVELTSLDDLMRRKMTLRSNISKAKKAGKTEKQQQWESELQQVEEKLRYAVQN